MALLKRVRVLGAKIETTSGTAETISAGDATFNVYDVEINADMPVTERGEQGGFGSLISATEGHKGSVTFKLNPYGSGAGSAPTWATTFLPACGFTNSGGTFSADAGNGETLTIKVYENGLIKTLVGAAGDFTLNMPTGKIGEMEFTFQGVWQDVGSGSILTPTYDTSIPLRNYGSLSLGGWTPCVENVSVAAGNDVQVKPCQGTEAGYDYAVVAMRTSTINLNPEATLTSDNDAYGDWIDATEKAFSYAIADTVDRMTVSGQTQIINCQEGDRSGVQIDDIELRVLNDDLSIAFSAAP